MPLTIQTSTTSLNAEKRVGGITAQFFAIWFDNLVTQNAIKNALSQRLPYALSHARFDTARATERLHALILRDDPCSPIETLLTCLSPVERSHCLITIRKLKYGHMNLDRAVPNLACKLFSLYTLHRPFAQNLCTRHAILHVAALACFSLAYKKVYDNLAPLYAMSLRRFLASNQVDLRILPQQIKTMELNILLAPTINGRLDAPNVSDYLEELNLTVPTLIRLSSQLPLAFEHVCYNVQAAIERMQNDLMFLSFPTRCLAAAVIYIAIEEKFEVGVDADLKGDARRFVQQDVFKMELCTALQLPLDRFEECLEWMAELA